MTHVLVLLGGLVQDPEIMWLLLGLLACVSAVPYQHETFDRRWVRGVSPQIVGGSIAPREISKYQVGLADSYTGGWYIFCGGTWVDDHNHQRVKVVTAAHCVEGLNNQGQQRVRLYFGMTNVNQIAQGFPYWTMSSRTIHPNYSSRTLTSDIAVLIINVSWTTIKQAVTGHSSTDINPNPIPIASSPYYDGEPSIVSGWGTTSSGGSSSSALRYVIKPIWSLDRCRSSNIPSSELDTTMLCSGETGKDACQGDSGGPLVVQRPTNNKLAGVVSWGYGCGWDGYPGVYADARVFKTWVENL